MLIVLFGRVSDGLSRPVFNGTPWHFAAHWALVSQPASARWEHNRGIPRFWCEQRDPVRTLTAPVTSACFADSHLYVMTRPLATPVGLVTIDFTLPRALACMGNGKETRMESLGGPD